MIPKNLITAWGGGNNAEPSLMIDNLPQDWNVYHYNDQSQPAGCVDDIVQLIPSPKSRALYYKVVALHNLGGGIAIQHDVRLEPQFDLIGQIDTPYPISTLIGGKFDDSFMGIPAEFSLEAFPILLDPTPQNCTWVYVHKLVTGGQTPYLILPEIMYGFGRRIGTIATHKPSVY